MNDEHIKQQHQFNENVLEQLHLKKGSKIIINKNGQEKEVEIAWINPHYHWFGTADGTWILPEQIVSINGINVQDEIKKLREIKEQNQAKSLATYLAK